MATKERKRKNAEAAKRWRERNPEKALEIQKKYRATERYKEMEKKYRSKYEGGRRLAILRYYSGGRLECGCCGERTYKFLALDHIHGGGNKHRRETNTFSAPQLHTWIIKNNFPPIYQVLCHNCNIAKGANGVCPHKQHGLEN